MIHHSLILIEGSVEEDQLTFSLGNAKQKVLGRVHSMGWIVHIAADTPAYLEKALLKYGQVEGVKSVIILMLKNM